MFDTLPSQKKSATAAPSSSRPLAWQLVFDGVWLARRDGRFAGMVLSQAEAVYKLTDAHGNIAGLFETLGDARSELQGCN